MVNRSLSARSEYRTLVAMLVMESADDFDDDDDSTSSQVEVEG